MSEIQVFRNSEFGSVKEIERSRSSDYVGFIYALEWDDAVKIGCTMYPYKRLLALKRQAEKYGNVKLGNFAVSKEHTNYRENETKLHTCFNSFRKGNTELFTITIQNLLYSIPKCVSFLNESEAIEQKSEEVCNLFKHMLMEVGK